MVFLSNQIPKALSFLCNKFSFLRFVHSFSFLFILNFIHFTSRFSIIGSSFARLYFIHCCCCECCVCVCFFSSLFSKHQHIVWNVPMGNGNRILSKRVNFHRTVFILFVSEDDLRATISNSHEYWHRKKKKEKIYMVINL